MAKGREIHMGIKCRNRDKQNSLERFSCEVEKIEGEFAG